MHVYVCVPIIKPNSQLQAPILPSILIDRLRNQQLSSRDQKGRGGSDSSLAAQGRLHSAGVRLARGWAHWWRLTPA